MKAKVTNHIDTTFSGSTDFPIFQCLVKHRGPVNSSSPIKDTEGLSQDTRNAAVVWSSVNPLPSEEVRHFITHSSPSTVDYSRRRPVTTFV